MHRVFAAALAFTQLAAPQAQAWERHGAGEAIEPDHDQGLAGADLA